MGSLVVRSTYITYGTRKKRVAIICLQNDSGFELPHPITDFIFEWKANSYNTMRKAALALTSFLNFVFVKKKQIKSLDYLNKSHLALFLNDLGDDCARANVLYHANILTRFYHYLVKHGLNKIYNLDEFKISNHDEKKDTIEWVEPLNILLPGRTSSNLIHYFDTRLIIPFLEIAYQYANRISFGVYMQIFGGLRVGDVVNLSRNDITAIGPWGNGGLHLKIQERNFRADLSVADDVKKQRTQTVLPYENLIEDLWRNHLKNYHCKEKSALFVDSKGNPMTSKTYRREFEKLKIRFLQFLSKQNTEMEAYSSYLGSKKWSTHICRGLFSNILANEAKTPLEVALLRGDSDLTSALTYVANSEPIRERIHTALQRMNAGEFTCLSRKLKKES